MRRKDRVPRLTLPEYPGEAMARLAPCARSGVAAGPGLRGGGGKFLLVLDGLLVGVDHAVGHQRRLFGETGLGKCEGKQTEYGGSKDLTIHGGSPMTPCSLGTGAILVNRHARKNSQTDERVLPQ